MRSRSCAILRDSPACARARASAVRTAIKCSPESEDAVIFANSRAQDNKGLLSDQAVEMDRRFQQKHARLLPPPGATHPEGGASAALAGWGFAGDLPRIPAS